MNDIEISPDNIPNYFNNYFVSIGQDLKNNIPSSNINFFKFFEPTKYSKYFSQ